jgi:hypothetical protein
MHCKDSEHFCTFFVSHLLWLIAMKSQCVAKWWRHGDVAATINRVARFFLAQYTKTEKYIKLPPNGHKIYQMAVIFPFERPPRFTQIWNFGFKTNHLATLTICKCFYNAVVTYAVKFFDRSVPKNSTSNKKFSTW